MDYAPDYHYYTSDIARVWPVTGKFSPVQRELLGFVLDYRNAILARIRPGVTARQIQDEAKAAMEPVFARTRFSRSPSTSRPRASSSRRAAASSRTPSAWPCTTTAATSDRELSPGVVFSVDPQLRVPEENIYLRYEDVVAVTPAGVENFTEFLPAELDAIERAVGATGSFRSSRRPAPARGFDRPARRKGMRKGRAKALGPSATAARGLRGRRPSRPRRRPATPTRS